MPVGMTILQLNSGPVKMPVEHGTTSPNNEYPHPHNNNNYASFWANQQDHRQLEHPHISTNELQNEPIYLNYESYNNNNNGKYRNRSGLSPGSMLQRDHKRLPRFGSTDQIFRNGGTLREYVNPAFMQQHDNHTLVNGNDGSGHEDYSRMVNLNHEYGSDSNSTVYDHQQYHQQPSFYRAPENGLNTSNNQDEFFPFNPYPESPDTMESSRNSRIVHDGYATLAKRDKRKGGESPSSMDLGMSYDSGLLKLFNSQKNGLISNDESQFLAHSLALSSSGNSSTQDNSALHRPNTLQLSQTMHALPQHEIQVQQARKVYLKESNKLYNTQPISNYALTTVTPEDFLGQSGYLTPGSSTGTADTGKSPLSQSHNSSNDSDSLRNRSSTSKSPLQAISENFSGILKLTKQSKSSSLLQETRPRLVRSSSTPNVLEAIETEDDDIDQDDYGFLTYRSFKSKLHPFKPSSSSAMQKGRATDVAGLVQGQARSLSKKWKKPKVTQTRSLPTSAWKPQGHCTWTSGGGKRLVLTPSHLLLLPDLERLALQKIAHAKLQNMNLGCPVVIPKDSRTKRTKSRVFSLKKRSSTGGLLDNLKDRSKDGKEPGTNLWVFGCSLSKVICNDKVLGHTCPCPLRDRRDSVDLTRTDHRKWSTSSVSRDPRYFSLVVCNCSDLDSMHATAVHNALHGNRYGNRHAMQHVHQAHGCGLSTESLSESDSRSTGSTLLDALSLSSLSKLDSTQHQPDASIQPHTPRVPYIVHCCFKHIETFGLNSVGIFRIGSSKKRVKQLREEFDSGNDIQLDEESSPNDVAALLKEFFRDLSDPLLTRDLYSPFLATCKIKDSHKRIHALRLLISLLPSANRDTLFALLRFLNTVVEHSTDNVDQFGETIPGNKMDSVNLATVFGPNVLHKAKGGEFQVESPERAEQHTDVITVIREMIENYVLLFELPPDVEDEVFRSMLDTSPEALDVLLRRKCQLQGMDVDGESSSMCEENDSLSASHNSETAPVVMRTHENLTVTPVLRPRTLSEALALSQEHKSAKEASMRVRPRTFNEALAMHQQVSGSISGSMQSDTLESPVHNVQTETVSPAVRPHSTIISHSTPKPEQFSSPHRPHIVQRRDRSYSAKDTSPTSHVSLKQMFRLSTPDPSWHQRESPRVSPSPKAMKPTTTSTPSTRARIVPQVSTTAGSGSTNERASNFLSSAKAFLISPRANRRKDESQQNTTTGNTQQKVKSNLLTVPISTRTSSQHASNSSLSSGYFGGSSRSGTTSPVSPPESSISNNKWYLSMDTPPHTPPSPSAIVLGNEQQVFDFSDKNQEPQTAPFHRTSSLHRPLGISQTLQQQHQFHNHPPSLHHKRSNSPSQGTLPRWQAERWKHWEKVAKQRSDESKEQETLV